MANGRDSGSPSLISHGSVIVLAALHESDGACRELSLRTPLSESSTYNWLTTLADAGILETYERQTGVGRPLVVYHLDDEELGAAAQAVVDRLGPADIDF